METRQDESTDKVKKKNRDAKFRQNRIEETMGLAQGSARGLHLQPSEKTNY